MLHFLPNTTSQSATGSLNCLQPSMRMSELNQGRGKKVGFLSTQHQTTSNMHSLMGRLDPAAITVFLGQCTVYIYLVILVMFSASDSIFQCILYLSELKSYTFLNIGIKNVGEQV